MLGFADGVEIGSETEFLAGHVPKRSRPKVIAALIFSAGIMVGALCMHLAYVGSATQSARDVPAYKGNAYYMMGMALPEMGGGSKKKKDDDKKDDDKEDPADECTTKPFGQCGGFNFTKGAHSFVNFSKTTSEPNYEACCPTGTQCVMFGPVWGMCMPGFGKPAAVA